MTEKQSSFAIPLILFIFAAVFAVLAKHTAYKVGENFFDLKANLYIPAILLIASIWSIVLTLKNPLSPILKLLSIALILIAIALLAFTLYKEVHPYVAGK